MKNILNLIIKEYKIKIIFKIYIEDCSKYNKYILKILILNMWLIWDICLLDV